MLDAIALGKTLDLFLDLTNHLRQVGVSALPQSKCCTWSDGSSWSQHAPDTSQALMSPCKHLPLGLLLAGHQSHDTQGSQPLEIDALTAVLTCKVLLAFDETRLEVSIIVFAATGRCRPPPAHYNLL